MSASNVGPCVRVRTLPIDLNRIRGGKEERKEGDGKSRDESEEERQKWIQRWTGYEKKGKDE